MAGSGLNYCLFWFCPVVNTCNCSNSRSISSRIIMTSITTVMAPVEVLPTLNAMLAIHQLIFGSEKCSFNDCKIIIDLLKTIQYSFHMVFQFFSISSSTCIGSVYSCFFNDLISFLLNKIEVIKPIGMILCD